MSTNLIINEQTNMRNDRCFNTFQDLNNNRVFEHSFLPSISSNNDSRMSYINSSNTRGILQNNNYDLKNLVQNITVFYFSAARDFLCGL